MSITKLTGADLRDDRETQQLAKINETIDAVNAGNTGTALVVGSNKITWGADTPEGAVTGIVGDLFLRTNGGASTTLYVKTSGSGNTGWTAK